MSWFSCTRAILAQIIPECFGEQRTSTENRADYLCHFPSDFPACNAWSLTRSDWLTYLSIYLNQFGFSLPRPLSRTLKCQRVTGCKWHALAAHWNVHVSKLGARSDTRPPHTEMYTQVTGSKKWHALAAHWNVHASNWVREVACARRTLKCTRW